MNYQQTLHFLYSQLPMFQRVGAAAYKANLETTIGICKALHNPERDFLSVHIAGTNGKGSVSHILASVFQAAGYKTGLYTSPHLTDFRERIKVNGQMVPKTYVTEFVSKYKDLLEEFKPSFFEYTVALAFKYFSEQKVDIAIIEVGMGGRLDSTNVITPLVSVITNISMDHSTFLGSTLQAIAGEKAGIIKAGIPVVVGETQQETKDVFLKVASEKNSPVSFADQEFRLERDSIHDSHYTAVKENIKYLEFNCPLKGTYQEKNFLTVIETIEKIRALKNFEISNKSISIGFQNVIRYTGLRGRWEILSENPLVICDVGHNEAGIREILKELEKIRYRQLHWVLGMVNDKEIDNILSMLPVEAHYYFCKAEIPRGLDADILAAKAEAKGLKGNIYKSVREAFNRAKSYSGNKDLVLVAGSTFTVAEVLS